MDWLRSIAPTIASALGGPLAGLAVDAVSKAIGIDPPLHWPCGPSTNAGPPAHGRNGK